MSGNFLDREIKAYRGRRQDNQLMSLTSIYFSTASIPPVTRNRILQGELSDPCSERRRHWILIESIKMYSSPRDDHGSDSDMEDDGDERPEWSKPHDTWSFRKL